MTDGTRAATGTAAGQQISDTFTGSGGADAALKPRPRRHHGQGHPGRGDPAFVVSQELADLGETDPRIVVLTADLAGAGRTADFRDRHPDRFFNMGVAEQNMISVAAGMAASGLRPYLSTFAAYVALLGCEQIRTDLAYPGLPVRILAHHSGMSLGYYGTSHHSLEDLSAMRAIADLTVVCAADANQPARSCGPRWTWPAAVHPAGPRPGPEVYPEVPALRVRPGRRLTEGRDLTLITAGSQVRPCPDAAALLAAETASRSGSWTCTRSAHQRGRGDRRGQRDRRGDDRGGAQS